jgi:hypothetical protein
MLNIKKTNNLKGVNMKHMREDVSKKIFYLDAQKGKLEIYFKANLKEQIIKATTVKQVVDALNITNGTDDDLYHGSGFDYAKENGFKNNNSAKKLWQTGYEVWLYSIQIQPNGKPLGFHLAFMKYKEVNALTSNNLTGRA